MQDLGEKCTSLSNDYQRRLYYRFFCRATDQPFHTRCLNLYHWKNIRKSHILEQMDQKVTESMIKHKKYSILYYHCTDKTEPPSHTMIPQRTQCARHKVLSILYWQYVHLWINPQNNDAKTWSFPQPRAVSIPCLRECSLRFHLPANTLWVRQALCALIVQNSTDQPTLFLFFQI